MTRSLKKGPFVASQVMEAVEKMNEAGKKILLKHGLVHQLFFLI